MKYAFLLIPGLVASLFAAPSLGGTQRNKRSYTSKEASVARPTPQSTLTASAVPAAQNVLLADSLSWQFGSRPQHGWRLYTSLVQRTLGTTATPETEEFAKAVIKWRRDNGLAPADGVLDYDAWMKLVGVLQGVRTRDTAPPPDSDLVQVDAAQWLYPERPAELRFVRKDAYAAYTRMVASARAELGDQIPADHLRLVSGYRTAAYQESIRSREGNPSSAQLARVSPHFSGRALDIYVGGSPVSTADANRAIQVATPTYKWLVANAHRFGFRPYFFEPWHWEYDPRLDQQR